ncbi:putative lipoprotein [Bacteroidetes bacterium oral taxon 272 str. F0290]|nr:putative lipoprotein [Bacteroidetes bacterium oral taxon 272 str. F0290]
MTKYQSVPVSFSTGCRCRGTQKIRIASFWGVPGEKLVPKAEEG